jgi:uncharacterized membrane protein YcaP (DUF421 family)
LLKNALAQSRLDIDTLKSILRDKEIFSIEEVDFAIFETNGKISILKRDEVKLVTKGDMGIVTTTPKLYPIPTEIISDGKINIENLERLQLTKEWLELELKKIGINSASKVFYAELQTDGGLYIAESC